MLTESLSNASITVNQDGISSLVSKLLNPQEYEIYIDDQKVGVLNGYQSSKTHPVAPGLHSIYVRAYARDSVSPTRVYGYSLTLEVNLAAGERKTFSCGVVKGPSARKYLIFTGVLLTLVIATGIGPIGQLPQRTRYLLVLVMAAITIACSWFGYSSVPGKNIYLKEI